MILGLGTDVTELDRIEKSLTRFGERFSERILHADEITILKSGKNEIQFVAGRFAAKEAAAKALGTGFTQGVQFKDIAITSDPSGKPVLTFHGESAKLAEALGISSSHVSISHGRDVAMAVVILEK